MKKECGIKRAASFLGKRWTLLILLELYKGNQEWKRFSQIKKSLMGITSKILSSRLKELLEERLVEKRVDTKIFPIKSEYKLTDSGKDFIKIIKIIKRWSLKWGENNIACDKLDCKNCKF